MVAQKFPQLHDLFPGLQIRLRNIPAVRGVAPDHAGGIQTDDGGYRGVKHHNRVHRVFDISFFLFLLPKGNNIPLIFFK